jgi:hypothetical protein
LIILDTRSSRPDIRIETIYFTQCVATWDAHTDLINQSVKFALLYALPLLFVSATYYQIVRVLWRSARFTVAAQPLQRQANNGQAQPATDEQQTRGEAILTPVEYFPFFARSLAARTLADKLAAPAECVLRGQVRCN